MSCNSSTRIGRQSTERIIPKARRKLRKVERAGTLPKQKAPAGLPVPEIFRHCGLGIPPCSDAFNFVARDGYWLALWTFHAMPDGRVRDKALDIALNELTARPM
jgi:hypothetical protein